MIAPVEPLINCTIGTDTKFVPAIVIVVAVAGAIVCEVSFIVGLVSEIVENDNTPDPFVINACPLVPVLDGSVNATLPENAEWAGAESETWWLLFSQFKSNLPEFVLPFTSTAPVPLGANTKSLFETVTISLSLVSKLPPNCGVVSADIEVNPVETFTQAVPL